MRYAVEARRFRPGLDYTLATAEVSDARLDVVLGLTPEVEVSGKGKSKAEANWESGEWGGWEVCLYSIFMVNIQKTFVVLPGRKR